MSDILKGKVALVTGAGRGIGRAEAMAFASQGAKVVVNGRTRDVVDEVVDEIAKAGGTAVPNYDSVASAEGARLAVETAIDKFGRIDILVNNAGVTAMGKVFERKPEEWDEMIRTNLSSHFYCTHYASKYMKEQQYGRIINSSSDSALGSAGNCDYSAAKEGIIGFTRTVARDMAEFGVTCNAIRPAAGTREVLGPLATSMLIAAMGEENAKKFQRRMLEYYTPEGVAPLVVYLASEPAGNVNACVFDVYTGHIGIFQDPPVVQQVLWKDGNFLPEELLTQMPRTLTQGKVSQFPAFLAGPMRDFVTSLR